MFQRLLLVYHCWQLRELPAVIKIFKATLTAETSSSFYARGSQPFLLLVPLCQVRAFLVPPKKLRYILLYKRYISCSVSQGSSYPLMFNLVPLGGTSTPGWEPLFYAKCMVNFKNEGGAKLPKNEAKNNSIKDTDQKQNGIFYLN